MASYEEITKKFNKFFSQDVLSGLLNSKVDVKEMQKFREEKVSKSELVNIFN